MEEGSLNVNYCFCTSGQIPLVSTSAPLQSNHFFRQELFFFTRSFLFYLSSLPWHIKSRCYYKVNMRTWLLIKMSVSPLMAEWLEEQPAETLWIYYPGGESGWPKVTVVRDAGWITAVTTRSPTSTPLAYVLSITHCLPATTAPSCQSAVVRCMKFVMITFLYIGKRLIYSLHSTLTKVYPAI